MIQYGSCIPDDTPTANYGSVSHVLLPETSKRITNVQRTI